MAVKKNTEKQTGSWIGEVEKYSRQIWLAGLGAYSKVSKDGPKLFDTLVKDGEKAEKAAKSNVDKQADTMKSSAGSARSRVDEVKGKAIGKWSELEEAFDKRLNSAISRLGVPSRNEVKALSDKVDLLTRQLETLTGVSGKPAAKAAAAKPAGKTATAAKPTTSSKTASAAAVKPAAKPAAAKPAAAKKKPASKTAAAKPASAAKTPVKPAAKPAAKAASKPAAKKPAASRATAAPATPAGAPGLPASNASGTQT